MVNKHKRIENQVDLCEGPVSKGLLTFMLPIFFGQLLQQLYNVADAWVVGNFADNDAFAAVSSSGVLVFLVTGFFNGVATGGGVVISRYFGAKDKRNVERAILNNIIFGVIASIGATIVGLLLIPYVLRWMQTPASVMPESLIYFRIYLAGVSTVIMYNIFMAIMRALGDSMHPLYYLILSSVVNVILDLILVAGLHWGVAGAAIATVFSQGLSMILCVIHMCRQEDDTRLNIRALRYDKNMMRDILIQGLPAGIQNSVISIGNIVVQTNINTFGAYAMSGVGAYHKVEGFVFLPIMSMSMALTTFISQNLGAGKSERAKKGAVFGVLSGVGVAEIIGIVFYVGCPVALRFFTGAQEAIQYGTIHTRTVCLFYFLLSFSHCAAGVLRGCGKSVVPMATMLAFWCGVRIVYVTIALNIHHVYRMIACAYPLTWILSSAVFLVFLMKFDWARAGQQNQGV